MNGKLLAVAALAACLTAMGASASKDFDRDFTTGTAGKVENGEEAGLDGISLCLAGGKDSQMTDDLGCRR